MLTTAKYPMWHRAILLTLPAVLLAACGAEAGASMDAPGASESEAPAARQTSAPAASPTPTPTTVPTVVSSAFADPVQSLAVGGIGEVTVTDLVVRSAPGTGSDSTVLDDAFGLGDRFFVVAGPINAAGYEWLQVQRIAADRTPTSMIEPWGPWPLFGWIALASRDGEAWVLAAGADCRAQELPSVLLSLSPEERLHCFGDHELSFTAELQTTGCGAVGGFEGPIIDPEWLSAVGQVAMGGRGVLVGEYDLVVTRSLTVQPSGVCGFPDGPLQIRGAFDHATAAACEYQWFDNPNIDSGPPTPPDAAQVILHCRTMFVARSLDR